MSALWAPHRGGDGRRDVGPEDVGARRRPLRDRSRLKVVAATPNRLARIPFIAVLIGVFGVGMAGLLMLNTTLQNQAFESRSLSRQANELVYSQAELESAISRQASPQELARRASAQGMRPNPYPAFVVMPSGKVVGDPRRVTGREMSSLVVRTPAELAAAHAAAEARRKAADVEKAAQERAEQLAAANTARQRTAQQAAEQRAAEQAAQQRATQRAAQPSASPAAPSAGNR